MGSVRWAFPCGAWRPRRREWLLAAQLVQPEEKDRIGQFVFARDAKAALAGRLLMRKLIAEKMCIPWNEVHLQRTSKGKPFLANTVFGINLNYNFNISHQGDYAVLAAEPELQVGIDIMKTNLPGSSSITNFFHIMKRQFTETEWDVIKSMSNEWMQLDMFYRHWALKESFLKAIGVGIGFNLQRIEFNVSPLQLEIGKVYKETKMLLDGEKEEEWTFEETRLDDHHHVAVALGKQAGFVQKDSDVRNYETVSGAVLGMTISHTWILEGNSSTLNSHLDPRHCNKAMICKEDRKEKIVTQASIDCLFVGALQDSSTSFYKEDKWFLVQN
ncbi:L-aminoadipate-semialdehyde dehydrogenase-phosphopantetheinyl transferase isoform X1 [Empidonax traillii]|uniref:L-aminoadipate-semialdehyde dehydrogenase-phosphopantetheinyl transferase isoform X1 n=1 Tax=Empidonax traillii TaxID=164674 RepID=UPI000FFDA396|nr:L-aminoadipate-semialdehyde dehydrogenase-phosphopantetheinyl transferase isoform X1 [Empidonax traillii]